MPVTPAKLEKHLDQMGQRPQKPHRVEAATALVGAGQTTPASAFALTSPRSTPYKPETETRQKGTAYVKILKPPARVARRQKPADRQRERRFDPTLTARLAPNLQTVLPQTRHTDKHLSAVKGRDGDAGLVREPDLSRLRAPETALTQNAAHLPKRQLKHLH